MKHIWLFLGLVIATFSTFAERQAFTLAGHSVAPGTRGDIDIAIGKGKSDPATHIPVSVFHGLQQGPVLAIVTGVHGFEFNSILAAAEFVKQVDPKSLHGTLIVVRTAHVAAFENRVPYVNPFDRENLNRAFPGSANGTQSQRIAWAISKQIVAKSDFLMDVHSGDGAEWLASFIGVYGGPLSSDYPKALAVAEAFGLPNIVRYKMKTQRQVDNRRSLNRQGVAQKIPTILVEIGENGSRNPKHIAALTDGFHNSLTVLGMTPNKPIKKLLDESPRYFDGTSSVPVKSAGIWNPVQAQGRVIEKGEVLGQLYDYHGNLIQDVIAPASGFALYGLAGPPVRAGESVMTIAKPIASLKDH